MPDRFAVAKAADWNAAFLDVGNDHNLRQSSDRLLAVFLGRRQVEITKEAAKGDEFLIPDRLVADEYDKIVDPSVTNGAIGCFVDIAEVNAFDFSAKGI